MFRFVNQISIIFSRFFLILSFTRSVFEEFVDSIWFSFLFDVAWRWTNGGMVCWTSKKSDTIRADEKSFFRFLFLPETSVKNHWTLANTKLLDDKHLAKLRDEVIIIICEAWWLRRNSTQNGKHFLEQHSNSKLHNFVISLIRKLNVFPFTRFTYEKRGASIRCFSTLKMNSTTLLWVISMRGVVVIVDYKFWFSGISCSLLNWMLNDLISILVVNRLTENIFSEKKRK